MKILYADSLDESEAEPLRRAGHQCDVQPDLTATTLPDAIGDADILVVRSTKVTAAAIDAADRLGLIVRAGAGTDTIDKAAASAAGVFVCNVPGRNAVAVAELTIGLLLAIDRRIVDNTVDLRAGRWNKAEYAGADGLAGKRLAIIGLGDIGLAVAERAKALGLMVSAVRKPDRSHTSQAAIRSIGVRMVEDLPTLLTEADIVSIHVPKSPDTVGMVDRQFLTALGPGTILLNTSRGEVVDEAALLEALDAGTIRAGLDVWPSEPSTSTGDIDSALARHPAVVGTHHIGASTAQAQRSVAEGVSEVISSYLSGSPLNCVNLIHQSAGTSCLTIRHLDQVGVLAEIFSVLRANGLNVQQMQNQVFAGGQAAVASINIDSSPPADILEAIERIDEVINVALSG